MYNLPENLEQDIKQFSQVINEFKNGEMNPVMFKGIRVSHGVYEQRKDNTFMLRIRCAGGQTTPYQLRKIAELSDKYGSGFVHITTRQEVQLHDVSIEHIDTIIMELKQIGLASRGGRWKHCT
jgi:sulfite reductase (ferredoxin)